MPATFKDVAPAGHKKIRSRKYARLQWNIFFCTCTNTKLPVSSHAPPKKKHQPLDNKEIEKEDTTSQPQQITTCNGNPKQASPHARTKNAIPSNAWTTIAKKRAKKRERRAIIAELAQVISSREGRRLSTH